METSTNPWAEHWRSLVEARRVQVESLNNQSPQTGYWDRRADIFRRMTDRFDAASDPLVALLRPDLPGRTLLDVGAGTGRYAIPLARIAASVTAVEPSAGMRRHLEDSVGRAGLSNVRIVDATWEDAIVDPHDVVLASHILYPIADVVPFIRKLDAHARHSCVICIRVDQIGGDLAELWQRIWGSTRAPEPTLIDLYNVLFSLDIRANVQLVPFSAGTFDNVDEAIEQARGMLFLQADDHQHDTWIKSFLAERLIERNGQLTWRDSRQAALVWWKR